MDLNELPPERKDVLNRISSLTPLEMKGLLLLIEQHDDLLRIVKRREAFGIVGAWMKNGAIWFTVIVGAYYMGIEKLTEFLKGLAGA